ncbi:MAG TPA: DNA methyltransferase [Chthoniobacteraceae bacterium]|nr:DNA methyltransferase [Chthoniobacteraceae bacterium]
MLPALLFAKPPVSMWWRCVQDSIPSGGREKSMHVWQQPVSEAEHFISHLSPPGGVVVDPCCGSGTVGIAALSLGRKFVGVEVAEATVAVARRRTA